MGSVAEDTSAINSRGGILLGVCGGYGGCNLLENLGFAQQKSIPVYEDNTACIEWGNNVIGGREHAKHIDIRKHSANGVIPNGHMMKLVCISTTSQLADILTKRLHYQQYLACVAGNLGSKVVAT